MHLKKDNKQSASDISYDHSQMASIEMTCLLPKSLPWSFAFLTLNGVTYGTNQLTVHIKERRTVSNKQVA